MHGEGIKCDTNNILYLLKYIAQVYIKLLLHFQENLAFQEVKDKRYNV